MSRLAHLLPVLAALSLLAFACHRKPDPRDRGLIDPKTEVSANPLLLPDYTVPIESLTLHGTGLGTARAAIPERKIMVEDKDGWVVMRDNNRFRMLNGEVAAIGVWDQKILSQLGVATEEDIAKVFGPPDAVEKIDTPLNQITLYRFAKGQRRVSWDRLSGKVVAVTLGSEYYVPPATKPAE